MTRDDKKMNASEDIVTQNTSFSDVLKNSVSLEKKLNLYFNLFQIFFKIPCQSSSDKDWEKAKAKIPNRFGSNFMNSWNESYSFLKRLNHGFSLAKYANLFFTNKPHYELLEEEVEIIKEQTEQVIEAEKRKANEYVNLKMLVDLIKAAEDRTSTFIAEKCKSMVQTSF